jgi:hypothetical protein
VLPVLSLYITERKAYTAENSTLGKAHKINISKITATGIGRGSRRLSGEMRYVFPKYVTVSNVVMLLTNIKVLITVFFI